jgi:single-stranded-DNA-specific exonuclease
MEPVRERRWNIAQHDAERIANLARECAVSPLISSLLLNRGIDSAEYARRFLSPVLANLHDPFLMHDMEKAADRLRDAVLGRETICVYGDYDADGVTSVAVLTGFLRDIGADCFYHIPNRLEEGYGLSRHGVLAASEKGARVIVTADCGITAFAEAELCAAIGIDLIITDHHTPAEGLPSACAVVNPMRADCPFPCVSLAGVGVVFNLLVALRGRLRDAGFFTDCREPDLREYLDLVALGTIADIVPLVDENRILVSTGLRRLSAATRIGVQALKRVAGITDDVDSVAVGFRLAPRLNAAGRLDDASIAVELLLTADPERAATLAAELNTGNEERQALEQEILGDALKRVASDTSLQGRKSIVLASDAWHSGVVGIVASRIVELYHRPTILIALQDGNGKGSGRSIPGFHLHDALRACSEHLIRFGGHKYAAGLTIDEGTLEEFTARFDEVAAGLLLEDDLLPEVRIDTELNPGDISLDTAEQVASLEPFGSGNPRPVFLLRGVKVMEKTVLKGRHLRMTVAAEGACFEAMGFSMAGRIPDAECLDLAFSLDVNTWKGRSTVRLRLKDARESELMQ